ncbi:MAG: carbon-nitrogen family hydrolase [Phycisphaerales bacterium]|nr:carbon-nitrogen family hydrolase [Phycisphaerales bacterium]
MRIHAIQADIVWEDHSANRAAIQQLVESALPEPGDFVVTPELCETGYTMDSVAAARDDSARWASDLARQYGVWVFAGIARRHGDAISNSITVAAPDGVERGCYRKTFLFTPGRERQHYLAGDGPCVFDCGGVKVAPLVCYDLRFPELFRRAAMDGAEIFTVSACWPSVRRLHWERLIPARAIENQAWVIAANSCGVEPTGTCAGSSRIVDVDGATRAECGSCAGVATHEFDVGAVRAWREKFPALIDTRREFLGL